MLMEIIPPQTCSTSAEVSSWMPPKAVDSSAWSVSKVFLFMDSPPSGSTPVLCAGKNSTEPRFRSKRSAYRLHTALRVFNFFFAPCEPLPLTFRCALRGRRGARS